MDIDELKELPIGGQEFLEEEKETQIHITKTDSSKFHIMTRMRQFIEYLLECEDFEMQRYHTDEEDNLIHLEGTLPITYLRFKKSPKTQNYLSRAI